jgi:hypothetical protein
MLGTGIKVSIEANNAVKIRFTVSPFGKVICGASRRQI